MSASRARSTRPDDVPGVPGGAPGDPTGRLGARPGAPRYLSPAELAEGFDAFYRESRDRLFVQTLALTGDLPTARAAVREAFVVAWHHWRKAAPLEDPEMYVRPLAWRKALRRVAARPLRRRRDVGEEARRVLDALSSLTLDQRRALLLTQLAAVTMDEMAHEVGLPLEAAERELQLGAAHLALELDIPTSSIPLALNGLTPVAEGVSWPRVTIVRRAGAARRRTHTLLGSAVAVGALVAGGVVSADTSGARPGLAREGGSGPSSSSSAAAAPGQTLPQSALLAPTSVSTALRTTSWQLGETTDNSTGNGLVLPCQGARYADPRGTAAWVRDFSSGTGARARRVVQFAEASTRPDRADRIFDRTLGWFASCTGPAADAAGGAGEGLAPPRLQLVDTADVAGLADRASVLTLRAQAGTTTHLVGVARTGVFTVTVVLTAPVAVAKLKRSSMVRLLAAATTTVCALPGAGACPTKPVAADRAPYPAGPVPWMLGEVDLPPLSRDQGPWVGTPVADLTEDRADASAISCDTASLFKEYRGQVIRANQFRTFVLSTATGLPPEVGLTQTVGALPAAAAKSLVSRLRAQVAACPDRDSSAGTEVAELARQGGDGAAALSAWRLTTALPGDRSVEYDVAIVRQGTSLSLLVYVSAPGARISEADFVALARRAQQRLATLQG